MTANSSVGAPNAGDTLTFSGQIAATGNYTFTKFGAGTVVLSNTANNYTGVTTVMAGTLKLGASGVIPTASTLAKSWSTSPGKLDLAGHDETINGLEGTGTVDNSTGTGAYTLTVGSGNASDTFSGVIQNTSGSVNLTKIGSGRRRSPGPTPTRAGHWSAPGRCNWVPTTSWPTAAPWKSMGYPRRSAWRLAPTPWQASR